MDKNVQDEKLLHSVALQNASSILRARQRAEEELLEAKDALRQANERVIGILESITDGFFVLDTSWRFTYVNRRAEEILRPLHKSRANLLGRELWKELPELGGTEFERAFRRAIDEQVTVELEAYYAPLSGWLAVRAYPSREGLTIYFQDVTRRKDAEEAVRRSEQFSRSVIESSRDCIKTLTLEGSLIWMSESGQQALCIGDVATILGKSWLEFWEGDDRVRARAAVEAAAAGGIGAFVGHFSVEGESHWWDIVITPIHDGDGQPQSLLAVSRDVTERMSAETKLRESEEQLRHLYETAQKLAVERTQLLESEQHARAAAERASRMKDEFLATLSHELRTPLSAILGWSQLLRVKPVAQDELRRGLETIERNARVQTQLIEDLLDMSRITSGKLRLDIQQLLPASVIDAALETVRPAAEAKGVRLEKILDPAAGPISGDPSRLQQVLWNLLNNAIKFTPKAGKVQLVLERVNSHIEISVADTGIGIAPEFLGHVFERFRQADASTTRQFGGLGLGLAIVKHLIELQGGTVRAESAGPDKGSTFTVSLPLAVMQRGDDSLPREHPRTAHAFARDFKAVNLSGVKVLVVDDQEDARELVSRVLLECNATVIATGSADEALMLVERERPNVLLSDIGMPDVDGFELLKRIRALGEARGGKVPAIALTAFARSEDRTRALHRGFQVHVSKPVEPAELIATVASVAGRTFADE